MAANEEFKGVIKTSILDSTPWWPEKPHAPKGAPNVLYIILDDTGYSHLSCYGGLVPTPNMDAIAAELEVSGDEVRAYFNGEGNADYHIEPGPDGGIVVFSNTRILEVALRKAWEQQNAL